MSKKTRRRVTDIAERTSWTFIQAAAGVAIASEGLGANVWKAAGIAGLLAVIKGTVAVNVGNDQSAAALPGSLDPPAGE